MPDIIVERLRALPIRRSDEVWEVGFISLPLLGGHAVSPIVASCVSSRGGAAMGSPVLPRDVSASAMIEAFAKFALDALLPGAAPLGYLPQRVHTPPLVGESGAKFAEAMESLGIAVEVKTELPWLADLAEFMAPLADVGSDAPRFIPGLMRTKGMTVGRVRAFAEAAAGFFAAEPWGRFPHEVLWRVEPRPRTRALSHFTIMGGAGELFGLGFLSSPMDMVRMADAESPMEFVESNPGTLWSMTFGGLDEFPHDDAELWGNEALPAAGPDAYPVPSGATASGRIQRPTPEQLTYMETVLRAATRLTINAARAGELRLEVPSFDGPRAIMLRAVME